jgi:hypothetical protein
MGIDCSCLCFCCPLPALRPPVRRAEGRGYLPAVMARRLARKGGSLLMPGEVGGGELVGIKSLHTRWELAKLRWFCGASVSILERLCQALDVATALVTRWLGLMRMTGRCEQKRSWLCT